jgi:transglutaminase/protease-like cytokinesis protein 3
MFRLMRVLIVLFHLCIFLGYTLRAQNLAEADRFARAYQHPVTQTAALDALIRSIDSTFVHPLEKTRAMFTWVAVHLEYDCREDGLPLKPTSMDQVLLTGKSQCAGYASLLQYGLRKMKLEAVTIRGIAKTAKKDLWWTEEDLRPNHAWNAVKIGERWVLLDPTWASGASDADCRQVTREFAAFYFDPPPAKFVLSHLPTDSQWQLIHPIMDKEVFRKLPVFHDPFYAHDVSEILPEAGILRLKKGELLELKVSSRSPLDSVAIWCEERKDIKPVFGRFTRKGDQYSFSYRIQENGQYFLNVSLDGRNTALVYDLIAGEANSH